MKLHKRLGVVMAVAMLSQSVVPVYAQVKEATKVEQAQVTNIVPNGDFEEGRGGWRSWNASGVSEAAAYQGTYGGYVVPSSSLYQDIKVKPNTAYVLTAYMRTEKPGEIMQITLENPKGDGVKEDFQVTSSEFEKYSIPFTTGNVNQFRLTAYKQGSAAWGTGKGYIDNIVITEAGEPVTGVEIKEESLTGLVGSTYALDAAVTPVAASNKAITYTSSDEKIATVNGDGQITFVAPGVATITATSVEGNFTDSCEVTVTDTAEVESVTMPENYNLTVGDQTTIKPVITPEIVGVERSWASSNGQVATVSADGRLTAVGVGETTITLTVGDKVATSKVKVSAKVANKIPNGGFENVTAGKPVGFDITPGSASITIDTQTPYMGATALKIDAPEQTKVSIGTNKMIKATDGVYGLTLHVKTEDMKGKLWVDVWQDKTDNVRITESIAIDVAPTTNGWQQIDVLFDGINVLRNVDFDIKFEGTGTVWVDEFRFYNASRIETLEAKDMTVDLSTVDYAHPIKLDYTAAPVDARDQRLLFQSSDSSVLEITEDGHMIPKKAGTVAVDILTKDHHKKAKMSVTLTGEVPADQIIKIDSINLPSTLTLEAGAGGKLNAEMMPSNSTHKVITWTSSNSDIVGVMNDGRLAAKVPGIATITATDKYGATASTVVTVTEKIDDKFDQVRNQWNEKIRKRKTAAEYDVLVDQYLSTMNTDSKRLYLWEDTHTDYRLGVGLGEKVIARLVEMAITTTLPESKYYKDDQLKADIADAIVWINQEFLGKEHEAYRKSWHWTIGMPKQWADLYMLTYDYLSVEEVQDGMEFVVNEANPNGIEHFSAANLVDAAKARIAGYVLMKDETEINRHLEMALKELDYVTRGSGFYADGSFVEHENIAYTGSYGTVLLNGLGDMVDIFGGTSFDIGSHPGMINLYERLTNTYRPMVSFGSFMDNVRGRAISRPGGGDHGEAHVTVSAMIKAGYAAPEPYRTNLLSQAKRMVLDDKEHFDTMVNFYVKPNIDKLMADTSIQAAAPYVYSHEFGGMNRTVHHTEKFGVGISKSSKRIATFEHLNGENKKGWNTGYGMTHIYNADLNQYQEGYWATIDHYRLPGTTADTGVRESSHAQYGDGEGTTGKNWAGGVSLNDTFGTSGMEMKTLRKAGSTLTANKSWFMFDDEVIALGSAINSTDNRNAETVVENRKIDLAGENVLTIDGVEQVANLGDTATVTGAKWAHLQGKVAGADIGYYFPGGENLNLIKEERTGNYKAINDGRNEEHTNSFATMLIDHGKAPQGEKYAYALVPGASAAEMEAYAKAPSFEILANEDTVHAVRHLEHNILAANFYSDAAQQVDYIKVDGDAAVMVQEGKDYLEIAIADPTMERSQVVVELVGKAYLSELESHPNVAVEQTDSGIRLTVDTRGSFSGSYEVKLATDRVVEKGPQLTMTTPSAISVGEILELTLGIDQVDTPVYAQDFTVAYDKAIFEVEEILELDQTILITREEGVDKDRILLVTDKGLVSGQSSVTLRLRAKDLARDTVTKVALGDVAFGLVDNGTSTILVAEGTSEYVTVKALDKVKLQETIIEAQKLVDEAVVGGEMGQYPQSAVDTLKKAIKQAEGVLNQSMSQTEINDETASLKIAIEAFKNSVVTPDEEDVNQDNEVNVADLALIAYHYQKVAGTPGWEDAKRADINKDGKIDILDVSIVAAKILKK